MPQHEFENRLKIEIAVMKIGRFRAAARLRQSRNEALQRQGGEADGSRFQIFFTK
ncbi:hypothetical protein [Methylobacterium nigriterrae]|uniref:hypothetical protein n=1 Tax=Methylobacterium nigriterrae TaxID=3127512 RepID=UPI0030132F7D